MESAIYCRVSTEEQSRDGFSIRAQEQKLKEYAHVKDWTIFNIYIDEGMQEQLDSDRKFVNSEIAKLTATSGFSAEPALPKEEIAATFCKSW